MKKKEKIIRKKEPFKDEQIIEITINDQLEKMLKKKELEINELKDDFYQIKKEDDNDINQEDVENSLNKLEYLSLKIEIISQELENLKKSIASEMDNINLEKLMTDYQNILMKKVDLIKLINDSNNKKNYISILTELDDLETEKEKEKKKLIQHQEEIINRDKQYDDFKDQVVDVDKIIDDLDDLVIRSNKDLEKIIEKVDSDVNVVEIVETKIRYSLKVFEKVALLMSIHKYNKSKKSKGISSIESVVAINLIMNLLEPKKETISYFKADIVDYHDLIKEAIKDSSSTLDLIAYSLDSIKDLKKYFRKNFQEYESEIPEYAKLYDKLDKMEDDIQDKLDTITKINGELDYQLDKNKQKVKKYENLN